jgi:hypothetical protein
VHIIDVNSERGIAIVKQDGDQLAFDFFVFVKMDDGAGAVIGLVLQFDG